MCPIASNNQAVLQMLMVASIVWNNSQMQGEKNLHTITFFFCLKQRTKSLRRISHCYEKFNFEKEQLSHENKILSLSFLNKDLNLFFLLLNMIDIRLIKLEI